MWRCILLILGGGLALAQMRFRPQEVGPGDAIYARAAKLLAGEESPRAPRLGRIEARRDAYAMIEPWHRSTVVAYEEPARPIQPQGAPPPAKRPPFDGKLWPRVAVDEKLSGVRALAWGDFDGDGVDELAAGGIIYRRDPPGVWSRALMFDAAGAADRLAVADFNDDGKLDIAARTTEGRINIYWNESRPRWVRHVVAGGYQTQTAIAADFTRDGRVDIIASNQQTGETILYAAPEFKPRVLYKGAQTIHSEAMDVDGDGDTDYIGARYSPGYIFWLEQPKDAHRDPWPFHLIDDSASGGVDGVHGLYQCDIDRDGKPDLIGNSGQPKGAFPNSLAWFRIPANPRAAPRWERNIFAGGDAPGLSHYLGCGDVNGDGRPDLACAAKIGPDGNWFAWWEQPANPRLAWKKHVIATGEEGATNILMADVDGNGKTDFVASRGHGRGLVWYEAPDWKPHVIDDTLYGPHSLALGDIDGDGDVDAATCAKDSFVAAWFENDGKGRFTMHVIHRDQAAYDIRLADIDGDGDLDVLIAGQQSANVVWYENRK